MKLEGSIVLVRELIPHLASEDRCLDQLQEPKVRHWLLYVNGVCISGDSRDGPQPVGIIESCRVAMERRRATVLNPRAVL